ncbi:hypothetical protein ACLB1E_24330 [Escherichia coli]
MVGKFVEFMAMVAIPRPVGGLRHHCQHAAKNTVLPAGSSQSDAVTLYYTALSGCSEDQVESVEKYAKARACGVTRAMNRILTDMLVLDMMMLKRAWQGLTTEDRVALPDVPKAFAASNELEVNATHKIASWLIML